MEISLLLCSYFISTFSDICTVGLHRINDVCGMRGRIKGTISLELDDKNSHIVATDALRRLRRVGQATMANLLDDSVKGHLLGKVLADQIALLNRR